MIRRLRKRIRRWRNIRESCTQHPKNPYKQEEEVVSPSKTHEEEELDIDIIDTVEDSSSSTQLEEEEKYDNFDLQAASTIPWITKNRSFRKKKKSASASKMDDDSCFVLSDDMINECVETFGIFRDEDGEL